MKRKYEIQIWTNSQQPTARHIPRGHLWCLLSGLCRQRMELTVQDQQCTELRGVSGGTRNWHSNLPPSSPNKQKYVTTRGANAWPLAPDDTPSSTIAVLGADPVHTFFAFFRRSCSWTSVSALFVVFSSRSLFHGHESWFRSLTERRLVECIAWGSCRDYRGWAWHCCGDRMACAIPNDVVLFSVRQSGRWQR